MENRNITHKNNVSAMTEICQTSGLQQEVIIPIKICKKKSGSHTYLMHQKDYYVVTLLSKLLTKAYIIDKRLKQNPDLTFCEFCKLNNITPRYLNRILQLNNLFPKLKRMIIDGYLPKHLSIKDIITKSVLVLWSEQDGGYCLTIINNSV